jgi:hypothetical protein
VEDEMTSEETGLPAPVRERIARAIHERYRRNQESRKSAADPAMQPWEELTESLKESNRHQAVGISAKLQAIGYAIAAANGKTAVLRFTPGELERLAVMEHERWVAERRAAGWTLGPEREVERKISPYFVPWEELVEEIREYDREAVRAIPEILAEAGLEIRRT